MVLPNQPVVLSLQNVLFCLIVVLYHGYLVLQLSCFGFVVILFYVLWLSCFMVVLSSPVFVVFGLVLFCLVFVVVMFCIVLYCFV
jgi:hypothetical protein